MKTENRRHGWDRYHQNPSPPCCAVAGHVEVHVLVNPADEREQVRVCPVCDLIGLRW